MSAVNAPAGNVVYPNNHHNHHHNNNNNNNNNVNINVDTAKKKTSPEVSFCQVDMDPAGPPVPLIKTQRPPKLQKLVASADDLTAKSLSKGTQFDGSTWRLPTPSYQRSRPTSLSQLSRHSQFSELSYTNYAGSPSYAFSATQSEMVLSPRTTTPSIGVPRHHPGMSNNRYTAVDMMRILPVPAGVSPSVKTCGCCCACGGAGPAGAPGTGQSHVVSHMSPENQDGPEGLSWRRLHMCRAKLKATATTSELLSGFAMVAMVELQINEPTAVPEWLFVMFAVCTTVLVSVHIFALMISTYLLPNVEAISKLQVSRLVTESPHERMRGFIELAWAFSTVLGLFLFLVEVAILCWVKFWDYSFTAATASTVIVIPVLIVFIAFAVHFYHSLVVYKCEASVTDMKELENIKRNLDNVASLSQSRV